MAEQAESIGADPDPFEAFNRRQGVGVVRNPYRRWAAMRGAAPVHRIDVREMMGRDTPLPPDWDPFLYTALSFDAVVDVLSDAAAFSSSVYGRSMGLVMGRSILEMDEPEHGAHRDVLARAFSRSALRRWERDLVRPVVEEFIARFRAHGRADLVRELTFPFPVRVMAGMIGLPAEEHAAFHRLAVELISIAFNPEAGVRASAALREMFARLVAQRRETPRDDLASVLACARLAEVPYPDEAIYAFLRLLAPAGAETTYRSSSNLLCGLLAQPEQWEAVRRDRRLVGAAIEEGLRWECPLTHIMRVASRDADVRGVAIPAGAIVSVNLAAANHDETRWADPDRFDLFRPARRHAAFAFGPHTCLGMHLARMETRVVLEALLELPGLRLDPEAQDVHVTGYMFRSPLALPVVFDA
jgi:cytochrome P450